MHTDNYMSRNKKPCQIGVKVKKILSQRGVAVGQVSYFLQMKKNVFEDMLSGHTPMPLNILWKLADFLDVEFQDLM